MSKGLEQVIHKREYSNGQKYIYENVLNLASYQRNTTTMRFVLLTYYSSYNEKHNTTVGKDVEQLELSCTYRSVNRCNQFRKLLEQ